MSKFIGAVALVSCDFFMCFFLLVGVENLILRFALRFDIPCQNPLFMLSC